jgi:hypothetical protein
MAKDLLALLSAEGLIHPPFGGQYVARRSCESYNEGRGVIRGNWERVV